MHLYKHTFIFRHMCTVHTTHTSYVWLIQRRIRSLTVTNSCWQPNTKKAHTLTPNLWGGLGIREGSDLAAGRHSCLHHTTYSLLLLPLLTPPHSVPSDLFSSCLFFSTLSLFSAPFCFCILLAISARYSVPTFFPSPLQRVIDSPSVHLSWKRRRRQCDVIHLAGRWGGAASLITGSINLTHRGRISAAVR